MTDEQFKQIRALLREILAELKHANINQMNDLKSDARSMITHYKRLGYKLEKESQVPYSYEMTRGSKVNPIIYILCRYIL